MSTVEWPEKLVQEAVRVLQKGNPYLHETEARKVALRVLDVVGRFGTPSVIDPERIMVLYREPVLTLGELDVA